MGIPPVYVIEELRDPKNPYDYVIFFGFGTACRSAWHRAGTLAVTSAWRDYFSETTGSKGLDFGDPFFYSTYTKKLYFKEKDFAFFWIKFGHMFDKRPWEV